MHLNVKDVPLESIRRFGIPQWITKQGQPNSISHRGPQRLEMTLHGGIRQQETRFHIFDQNEACKVWVTQHINQSHSSFDSKKHIGQTVHLVMLITSLHKMDVKGKGCLFSRWSDVLCFSLNIICIVMYAYLGKCGKMFCYTSMKYIFFASYHIILHALLHSHFHMASFFQFCKMKQSCNIFETFLDFM